MSSKDPSDLRYGGVVHVYQKYDPRRFPSPQENPPDVVSKAFDHFLRFGARRPLTEEELANAIHLDPAQFAGLGPSIDHLMALLRERRDKILATYEVDSVRRESERAWQALRARADVPRSFQDAWSRAAGRDDLAGLERLWFAVDQDQSSFARFLIQALERLGDRYEMDELAARFTFRGTQPLSLDQAKGVKEELEEIERLLEQLEAARKDAQLAIVDFDALERFVPTEDVQNLDKWRQQIADYLRELANLQGIDFQQGQLQLGPAAYRLFQAKLLDRIFSGLEAGRSGRHTGPIDGDGAVELPSTKAYEYGDSMAQLDLPQSLLNALIRQPFQRPIRLRTDDLEVHRTRNRPKCATVVIMDMSGSMRYDEQYINVKRMALGLDGLIRREYPGDFLEFVQMFTHARRCHVSEIINLLPQPVTLHDPIVRLRADLSRPDVLESQIPPHFTNIQQALSLARRLLATQDTPNRQIILITDGLPTAHCEEPWLYLLYPPDPRTERATMAEGIRCANEGIRLNLFLVPSWSQSEEDIRFAHRLSSLTQGRVFFTAGRDLDRFVVWDYLRRRREIMG